MRDAIRARRRGTKTHERWIAGLHFEHEGDRVALAEYQLAAQAAEQRVQRLTNALAEAVKGWRFEPVVAALRALRGIDTVGAIGLITETGDIGRFSSARQLDLVPEAFQYRPNTEVKAATCERNPLIYWLPDLGSNQGPTD